MEDIALHVLDIVENSLRAGATRVGVTVTEDHVRDRLSIVIIDNGRGMRQEDIDRLTDPFFTTKPGKRVGLGLALFAQAARESGGGLKVSRLKKQGLKVEAGFHPAHPDCKPIGKMDETIFLLRESHPEVRFDYIYKLRRNRDEIKDV